MAISARSVGEGEPIADMNTTPLIDVLLVLLIMFIITLPLVTHSTNLQLGGGTPSIVIPEVVHVDIDFDGAVLWNGALIRDFDQLEGLLRQEAARKVQADLQVRPDGRAAYDTVARVLALAQRSGIQRIGVSSADD